jgi:hypothetical protein
LYSSPNINRKIKSRSIRWTGLVACMGEKRTAYMVSVGKPEGKDHWENRDISGKIILKWIIKKQDGVVWTGLIWLRIGTSGRLL